MDDFKKQLSELQQQLTDVNVFEEFRDDTGDHPEGFQDYECQFAANHINAIKPAGILDVGSYRQFLMGLMAHYPVTTIDVRERKSNLVNENPVTCDAAEMKFDTGSFDMVVSLCALEHIGLGRYGDPLDINGDQKAVLEMIRVLKPGGHIILTTTIHNQQPAIAFNAHRIYNHDVLKNFMSGLHLVDEKFFSHTDQKFCSWDQVTVHPKWWDVYMGCWQKV